MNHRGTKPISTNRLLLRPFCPEDAEPMFRNWAADPAVTRFLTWPTHTSPEVSKQIVALWISGNDNPKQYLWAIALHQHNEPIGNISAVQINEKTAAITIGYCLGRSWWGQGIITEALQALLPFFFEEVGAACINACHDPRNPASGRVMQKCGMKYEGTWRAGGVNNQGICDESWYSILKPEYLARKEAANAPVGVRAAGPEDLDALLHLYLHLHEDQIPPRDINLMETWRQITEDPNHHLIVYEADGTVVSSCVCVVVPNLTRGVRPYALIENVVTHPAARNNGYASACLAFAREIALKHNCYKMMLLTGSACPAAQALYRNAGYSSSEKTAFLQRL